jgi:ribosomal protein S14
MLAAQQLQSLRRQGAISRHRTRCRTSGRARQVLRVAQLARLHLRSAMSEGRLAHLRHGRRTGCDAALLNRQVSSDTIDPKQGVSSLAP